MSKSAPPPELSPFHRNLTVFEEAGAFVAGLTAQVGAALLVRRHMKRGERGKALATGFACLVGAASLNKNLGHTAAYNAKVA